VSNAAVVRPGFKHRGYFHFWRTHGASTVPILISNATPMLQRNVAVSRAQLWRAARRWRRANSHPAAGSTRAARGRRAGTARSRPSSSSVSAAAAVDFVLEVGLVGRAEPGSAGATGAAATARGAGGIFDVAPCAPPGREARQRADNSLACRSMQSAIRPPPTGAPLQKLSRSAAHSCHQSAWTAGAMTVRLNTARNECRRMGMGNAARNRPPRRGTPKVPNSNAVGRSGSRAG